MKESLRHVSLFLALATLTCTSAFVPAAGVAHVVAAKTTPLSSIIIQQPRQSSSAQFPPLFMAEKPTDEKKSSLPFLLDPGTKGGAMFLSLVLFIVPIIVYNIAIAMGADDIQAGIVIGVGFTVVATLAWVSSYLFRVATKDMTYAKQLKDYENAVIAKRLEELDEDEIQALQEEIERDNF